MSGEAAPHVSVAVREALLADTDLVAFYGGQHVYNGKLPQGKVLYDWIELGSLDAGNFGRLNQTRGERTGLVIQAWTKETRANGTRVVGKDRAERGAAHIARVLEGEPLILPEFGEIYYATVIQLGTFNDPDDPDRWSSQLRYEAIIGKTV